MRCPAVLAESGNACGETNNFETFMLCCCVCERNSIQTMFECGQRGQRRQNQGPYVLPRLQGAVPTRHEELEALPSSTKSLSGDRTSDTRLASPGPACAAASSSHVGGVYSFAGVKPSSVQKAKFAPQPGSPNSFGAQPMCRRREWCEKDILVSVFGAFLHLYSYYKQLIKNDSYLATSTANNSEPR